LGIDGAESSVQGLSVDQASIHGVVGSIVTECDRPIVDISLGAIFVCTCLLDTGSLGARGTIANYISKATLNKIKELNLRNKKAIDYKNCICQNAVTRTQAGSFTTSECITLELTLHSKGIYINKANISFRVAYDLKADMIIGFKSIRELDLVNKFNHLFC
jgi:hypothetical protein